MPARYEVSVSGRPRHVSTSASKDSSPRGDERFPVPGWVGSPLIWKAPASVGRTLGELRHEWRTMAAHGERSAQSTVCLTS